MYVLDNNILLRITSNFVYVIQVVLGQREICRKIHKTVVFSVNSPPNLIMS